MKENWELWLFVLPGLVITFIFSYVPLYGITIAFQRFSANKGFFGSPWVGFDHFIRFFESPYFVTTLTNTFIISLYSLVVGFPIPIILALMLNSFTHKRYRKVIQTVTYAPNFISVVVMCGMLILFLSPSTGFVNKILGVFGISPINFMGEVGMWRHIYVWSGVWQSTGWNSVIYFAALAGVSPEYHEAAIVDGASKFQRIRYITLPFLRPTIITVALLSIGRIFNSDFGLFYQVPQNSGLLMDVTQTIDTFVYRALMLQGNVGMSAAASFFQSCMGFMLILLFNAITNKISKENALF